MARLLPIFVVLCAFFSITCQAGDVLEFTVLSGGNPAGFQKVDKVSASEYRVEYEYNDRGRGPKLSSHLILNPKGVPTTIQNTGNNYFKAAVNETFKVDGKRADWKNTAEQGGKEVQGNEFYISQTGVPEEIAILARALLQAPEQKLPLLPEGEAKIQKASETLLKVDGQNRRVVQYVISGLDFTAISIWLDPDQTFFAFGESFFFTVRKGWEKEVGTLIKAQEVSQAIRLAKQAKGLVRSPRNALLIRNALLFDSETAETKTGQSILIQGNRIKEIGVDAEIKAPISAQVLDVAGKFVMPGLWDMHVHLNAPDGLLHIATGVTSVRDMANDIAELAETRSKFDSGELVGPRVVMSGFIDGPGPYAGPSKILVDNEKQARAEVDNYAKLGVSQIKLYSSLKPELVAPIVDQARKHGLRVSGHIPAFMTAEQAVKAGYGEIQHANMLFLNFLFDIAKDTRTPLRFTAVAENAAKMDLKSAKWQSFLALLKEKQIIIDPTVSIFEQLFTAKPGEILEGYKTIVPHFPPQVRRAFLTGGLPIPEGKEQLYKDSFRKMVDLVGELYRSNITLVAGTDSLPGFTLHRELELYAEAGIPPAKVLQLATLTAAKVAKQEKDSGSIAPGKFADLIIVDGNPAEKISDIRNVDIVIKDGMFYKADSLYRSLGIK